MKPREGFFWTHEWSGFVCELCRPGLMTRYRKRMKQNEQVNKDD